MTPELGMVNQAQRYGVSSHLTGNSDPHHLSGHYIGEAVLAGSD